MDSSKQFLCDVCGVLFNFNQNHLRHVRTVHQGMKRMDNEKRKSDRQESTDEAREPCTDIRTCEAQAKKTKLSHTYNSDIEAAIMEKFNPTDVICFCFVIDSPWTVDLKMRAEDCFEEIMRECIINKKLVVVEHASTEEQERSDDNWIIDGEAKLMLTDEMVSWLVERKGRPWNSMLSS